MSDFREKIDKLMKKLDEKHILYEAEDLTGYGADSSFLVLGPPGFVVFPKNEEEVFTVVDMATKLGIPVTPRGAGSGTAGAALALPEGILLILERLGSTDELGIKNPFPKIPVVDTGGEPVDLATADKEGGPYYARVGPGVTTDDLNAFLNPRGYEVPVVPSSGWSTVGGNFSTNAGGSGTPKYGVFCHIVHRLRLVGTGPEGAVIHVVDDKEELVKMGASQGLMGAITELDVMVTPIPPPEDVISAVTYCDKADVEELGAYYGAFMKEMQERCKFTAGEFMLLDATIVSPDDPVLKVEELRDVFGIPEGLRRFVVLYQGLKVDMEEFPKILGEFPDIQHFEITPANFKKMMVVRKGATGKAAGRVALAGFEDVFLRKPEMLGKVLARIFSITEGKLPGRPIGHQYAGGLVIHYRPQALVTPESYREAWELAMELCGDIIGDELDVEKRREHGLGLEICQLTPEDRKEVLRELKAKYDVKGIFNTHLIEGGVDIGFIGDHIGHERWTA